MRLARAARRALRALRSSSTHTSNVNTTETIPTLRALKSSFGGAAVVASTGDAAVFVTAGSLDSVEAAA